MKKFISFYKENVSHMVKMNVYQIAMTIFGLVLAMACTGSNTLLALSSVVAILFYLFLLYFITYEIGQKDGIRIEGKRLAFKPLKGMWISLCANLLNILLGILAVIGKLCISDVSIFENLQNYSADLLSPGWAVNLYEVCHTLAKFIQGMYTGVSKVFFSGNVLVLLLMPLPAILTCAIAYPLGVKYCNGYLKKEKKVDKYR